MNRYEYKQRQLNNAGIYAATSCAEAIEKLGAI